MRNAGLNETRCQNEVSENQAPAADSTTSKVTISRRVTEFCKQTVCPQGRVIGIAYRSQTNKVFQVYAEKPV